MHLSKAFWVRVSFIGKISHDGILYLEGLKSTEDCCIDNDYEKDFFISISVLITKAAHGRSTDRALILNAFRSYDPVVLDEYFFRLASDPYARALPAGSGILDGVVANHRTMRHPIDEKSPTFIVTNRIFLEGNTMSRHRLSLRTPVYASLSIADDRV